MSIVTTCQKTHKFKNHVLTRSLNVLFINIYQICVKSFQKTVRRMGYFGKYGYFLTDLFLSSTGHKALVYL